MWWSLRNIVLLFIQLAGDLSEFVHMASHWSTAGCPRAHLRQQNLSIFSIRKGRSVSPLAGAALVPQCHAEVPTAVLHQRMAAGQCQFRLDLKPPAPQLPPKRGWGSPFSPSPSPAPTCPSAGTALGPWAGVTHLSLPGVGMLPPSSLGLGHTGTTVTPVWCLQILK